MTPEEYARWRDFAGRLARHGWPEATDARKEKVAEAVDWFIEQWEHESQFAEIDNWDGAGPDSIYLCDEATTFFETHWHVREDGEQSRFEEQFKCCVRAGFDVAVEPSAGVLGFTVGTLRSMYDGDIPEWVVSHFEPPLPATATDDEGVWL